MTTFEFKKKFNLRTCEKCCSNCKHGHDLMDEGMSECTHPKMDGDTIITAMEDVCDVWEGKERKTEKEQNH